MVPSVTSYPGCPASTCASVLFPDPLGPITACTSPSLTVRSTPRRISFPAIDALRFLISNTVFLIRELAELAETTENHNYCRRDAEAQRTTFSFVNCLGAQRSAWRVLFKKENSAPLRLCGSSGSSLLSLPSL